MFLKNRSSNVVPELRSEVPGSHAMDIVLISVARRGVKKIKHFVFIFYFGV